MRPFFYFAESRQAAAPSNATAKTQMAMNPAAAKSLMFTMLSLSIQG